jgi:hypothetical protein
MATKQAKWVDETSYSRNETERTPRTWVCRTKDLQIVVTRRHMLTGWYLLAREVGLDQIRLLSDEIAEAKIEALALVRARLTVMMNSLDAIEKAGV